MTQAGRTPPPLRSCVFCMSSPFITTQWQGDVLPSCLPRAVAAYQVLSGAVCLAIVSNARTVRHPAGMQIRRQCLIGSVSSRATGSVRARPRHPVIHLVPLACFLSSLGRRTPLLALRGSSQLDRFTTASFPVPLRCPRPLQPESPLEPGIESRRIRSAPSLPCDLPSACFAAAALAIGPTTTNEVSSDGDVLNMLCRGGEGFLTSRH